MAINLQKGQRIEIGLQKVGVGLGWDPRVPVGKECRPLPRCQHLRKSIPLFSYLFKF